MAILNNLIVNGRSRFLNGINADSIHTDLIDANDGIFKTITTTTLDAGTITTDMLTATNARVSQTLTVDGTISTNKWEAANIANIGGNFYISPTGKADSGTITVTKTSTTTVNGVSVGVYTLVVGSASFGVTSTSSTIWGTNSKVIFTGSISYNSSKKYPLGTCNGTMTTVSTGTNTLTGFTITGINSPALDIFFKEVGVTSVSSTVCSGYEMQISVYQSYYSSTLHPIGILLTSYGKEKKQYIDIYGGANTLSDSDSGFAEPSVRVGQLDGLPNIVDGSTAEATKPTGWGIYTTNGFFKGKIVSNAGLIANFTINGSKLYSNGHSAYNTATTGIYIGDDYISFGSGGVTYFNTSGTGKVGPWTLSTTYFRNGNITSATNTSVPGVYLGTDGLNISNGTAATTSYITKTAVNIGNKLTWNGTTLSVTGAISATSLSTGTKTSATVGNGTFIDSSGNIYSGNGSTNNFSVTSAGALTATSANITGTIDATSFSAKYYDNSNVLQRQMSLDASGLIIQDGTSPTPKTLAKFGTTVQIGKDESAHLNLGSNELILYDGSGNAFFKIRDAVNESGQVTDTFAGDGEKTEFNLSYTASNTTYTVTQNGTEVSPTKTTTKITFSTAPAVGDIIVVVYNVVGNSAKTYELGIRKTNTISGSYSVIEGYETTASGTRSHAEGGETTASGSYSHAEGYGTTASEYYSHVEGYKTTANGMSSHAEGGWATASGLYSHAEGYGTTASNSSSHAEGYRTIASGVRSHAEGYLTRAYGKSSHAEGYDTGAKEDYSHAEGWNTYADGQCSHAEGRDTKAHGARSHASGFGTIANLHDQMVIGRYNLLDPGDGGTPIWSKYAFIIGNGEDPGNGEIVRSNALTVDWDGNVEAAGALFANGAEFSKKASNHIVIAGYHICWGTLTVNSPTLNAYAERTVTLPYTYTGTPFCIASCANRAARARTAYASQGDQTGNKIRVGYYATASDVILINYLTIGV